MLQNFQEGKQIENVMEEFLMRDSIATTDLRLNTEGGDYLGQEYDMLFKSMPNPSDMSM